MAEGGRINASVNREGFLVRSLALEPKHSVSTAIAISVGQTRLNIGSDPT